jgi:phage/plasmid-like protein (TIGR03299 family)
MKMSHNINSLFYYEEKPWHHLGKKVEAAQTSAGAIVAAGLDWRVNKVQLQRTDGVEVNAFATVREDTRATLGVVGYVYRPLQNKEAFSFFDAIVGEKAAIYHTAGALGDGETVWILAKLPGYIRVVGDDVSEKYLLLANRHDGGGAVRVQFTPIRVVCQNTLNIALTGAERSFRARHTGALGQRVKTVQDYLGIVDAKSALFEEAARKLATVQLTQEAWKNYAKASGLVPETPEGERPSSRAYQIIEDVSRLFERGKGQDLPGARGTAWGAFNAVVEYVDYVRSTRNDKRAESLLFGSGAQIKQAAWDNALALAR